MQKLLDHVTGFILMIMAKPRKIYHKCKAKRCYADKCCIICNNCTGGVILHDLGLKFDTPTINTLFYTAEDFLFFVDNIRSFSKIKIFKIDNHNYSYPVGGLRLGERLIKIGFVHYLTFEEARDKWIERFRRVDFDKVMVLWEGEGLNENDLSLLNMMSFNKLVFSMTNKALSDRYPFYLGSDLYKNWYPGKILDYKHIFAFKRNLDDFDYISFINKII